MKERLRALQDSVWIGITIGFLAPLLPGFIAILLMYKIVALHNADLLLIACIAINAWLMNVFFKLNKDNIGRGIISITFLWAFAFFYYKVVR